MRLGIAVLCLFPVYAAAQDWGISGGQDRQAGGLSYEAVKLRTAKVTGENFDQSMAPLRAALRDWIESKLPKSRKEFLDRGQRFDEELERDLKAAKITPDYAPKKDDDPEGAGFGYASVMVHRLPELPDMAFVTASATIPCGAEDSIYAYKFDASGWRRVIVAHSEGMGDTQLELSEPDSSGQRLVLTRWQSQQCTSSFMVMAYKVFRLDWDNGVARPVLDEKHGGEGLSGRCWIPSEASGAYGLIQCGLLRVAFYSEAKLDFADGSQAVLCARSAPGESPAAARKGCPTCVSLRVKPPTSCANSTRGFSGLRA